MKNIKNINIDKKYLKISACVLGVIILAVLFVKCINNAGAIASAVTSFISGAVNLLSIFIFGFFIAYFLNPPVRWFEKKLGCKKKLKLRAKLTRVLSILIVLILFICFAAVLAFFAVPEIAGSAEGLLATANTYMGYLSDPGAIGPDNPFAAIITAINSAFGLNLNIQDILSQIAVPVMAFVDTLPSLFDGMFTHIVSFLTNVMNFIIGIVMAFYMLCEKDNIKNFLSKLFYTFFKKSNADKFLAFIKQSNSTIERYTVGLLLDSTLVGMIYALICTIFGFPFPALQGVLMIIANLIPYFGPILGGVAVTLITFSQDPIKGIGAGAAILLLQQFDGNIMQPKVVGESIGLKPLSVIFSVLVGGALFGPAGMFFGSPIFSVISSAFKTYVNNRYNKKYAVVAMTPADDESAEN